MSDLKRRKALDEEHKHLLASLERLEQTDLAQLSDEQVFEQLQIVRTQLWEHFCMEEAVMQKDGFPEVGAHKGQHDMFLEDLDLRISNCPETVVEQGDFVVDLLKHTHAWLQRHLETQDARYLDYLSGQR